MSDSIALLVIDPQVDFCDKSGSLYVNGAERDMSRLGAFLRERGSKIDAIYLSLDSHHVVDISHPAWFVDGKGKNPAPFTVITAEGMGAGRWQAANPQFQAQTLAYLQALEAGGRYPHVIWPEHCLIGSQGHGIYPEFLEVLHDWERQNSQTNYLQKGHIPVTEHFSVIRAEVPSPEHPETQVNRPLVQALEGADQILVAGQALSHCVANTIRDLVDHFESPTSIQKVKLLVDCTSSVSGFESTGQEFLKDYKARGMGVIPSTSLFA